jgi:hypothetical protein
VTKKDVSFLEVPAGTIRLQEGRGDVWNGDGWEGGPDNTMRKILPRSSAPTTCRGLGVPLELDEEHILGEERASQLAEIMSAESARQGRDSGLAGDRTGEATR